MGKTQVRRCAADRFSRQLFKIVQVYIDTHCIYSCYCELSVFLYLWVRPKEKSKGLTQFYSGGHPFSPLASGESECHGQLAMQPT